MTINVDINPTIQNIDVDLSTTTQEVTVDINPTSQEITVVLDTIEGVSRVDLDYISGASNGVITSNTGRAATIPSATDSDAGLFLPSEKIKLSGIEANATADQTASEIKTAYESNPNTNAFTDEEKSKLSGIAAGAEVNVNADWNATSGDAQILNKPTLGTAAAANVDDFATSTQGSKADTAVQPAAIANFETTPQLNARDTANRDRANHTGTQAISTVTGLQTALDGKQPSGDYATNSALNNGLSEKQDALISGTNIKTINLTSLLGGGNVSVEPVIFAGTTSQYWRGDKSWQTLDKTAVGLGNVDNTSDVDKPISAATQTALNGKLNAVGDSITGSGGSGFLGFPSQSSPPSTPSSGFRVYANASNALSWRGQNGFVRTFDGTSNTADRSYVLPNESGTIALTNSGQVINGVAVFYQSTPPTTRVGGAALVDNDIWYDSSTGRQWIRRGIYWLGERIVVGAGQAAGRVSATSNFFSDNWFTTRTIYVERTSIAIYFVQLNQVLTNHWDISVGFGAITDAFPTTQIQTLASDTENGGLLAATNYLITATPNSIYTMVTANAAYRLFVRLEKTGASTNELNFGCSLIYREIYA